MSINPTNSTTNFTYGQLKAMVGVTEGMKIPTRKQLIESDVKVLFHETVCGSEYTVYENGFYIYSCDGHSTVYGVDRCRRIGYEHTYGEGKSAYNKTDYIDEAEFIDGPWYMPLMIVGEHRLEHNMDSREQGHVDFSLSNDGTDWDEFCRADDFTVALEEAAEQEEEIQRLYRAMEYLTEEQKKVIRLRYWDKRELTQTEIAEIIGTSQPNVNKHLKAALKCIKKNY